MKRGDEPELLVQFGKLRVLAKGPDAIRAVKVPLRAILFALAIAIVGLTATLHLVGLPSIIRYAGIGH